MIKCYSCSKIYPKTILRKMVHTIDNKAYITYICPACQALVANNPNYYYLVED